MKEKILTFISNISLWSLRRKIFAGVVLLIVVFSVVKIISPTDNSDTIVSEVAKVVTLKQTVLATGQVTSNTDLNLSFNTTGVVKSVRVKVGDKVRAGQVLAALDNGSAQAVLTQARGAFAAAQARYDKIKNSYTTEEIELAKVLLSNAKQAYEKTVAEQDALVSAALNNFSKKNVNISYFDSHDEYTNAQKARDSAVAAAQALVNQRQSELNVKLANPNQADIRLAEADILSAQGGVEAATATYNNTVITAPANGTITSVDIKYGELAQSNKEVIILQDVENLYIEATINETNIALLTLGQEVTISYDAFGSDKISYGKVYSIDPASTTKEGIVNYKIKVAPDEKSTQVKPGMNANITVKIFEKPTVLVVPSLAIHKKDTGVFVDIITNSKIKTYKEAPVTIGAQGDGNLVEITSGLSAGDEVVVLNKNN